MRRSDVHVGRTEMRVAVGLAIVLALSLVGWPAGAQDGDIPQTGVAEIDAMIVETERVIDELRQRRDALRSDRIDASVVVEDVGPTPDALATWVARETRWLPYRGALRGAQGTLMERSGSSLDRALLLAALLDAAGLEPRLATTTLDAEVADRAAARELARTWEPEREARLDSAEAIAGYRAAVTDVTADLEASLEPVDPTTASDPRSAAADIISEHWWVQAATADGVIDVDPLFLEEAAERPPATATYGPEELPDEQRHELTIRVVIGRTDGAGVAEEAVLEETVRTGSGDPTRSFSLSFDAAVAPEFAERARELEDPVELADMMSHWRPVLDGPDGTVTGEWFSASGVLEAPAPIAQADALSGGLDALGGLGDDEGDGGGSHLLSARIEYTSDGPGIEPRTERRWILDLAPDVLGTDAASVMTEQAVMRRGLALLGETSILLQAAAPHPDAVLARYIDTWIGLRPSLIALLFIEAGVEDERIVPSLRSAPREHIDLLTMTSARHRWGADSSAFVARPNVWSRHSTISMIGSAPIEIEAVDVVINDVDVLGPRARARSVRIGQGVLDTLVEGVFSVDPEGSNTFDRYERRQDEGTEWLALAPGAGLDAEVVSALPATDIDRIRARLQDGDAVLVASSPRVLGAEAFADWWRVAPDGTTLGMGFRGWGAEVTNEGNITVEISLARWKELDEIRKRKQRIEWMIEMVRKGHLWAAEAGVDSGWSVTFSGMLF